MEEKNKNSNDFIEKFLGLIANVGNKLPEK